MERKTCPKSLQYRARARIRADTDFRKDIKRIRTKAEQEFVQSLIRFHYRKIESLRTEIRRGKRPRIQTPVNKSTATRNEANNTVTTDDTVQKVAKTIEENITQKLSKEVREFFN